MSIRRDIERTLRHHQPIFDRTRAQDFEDELVVGKPAHVLKSFLLGLGEQFIRIQSMQCDKVRLSCSLLRGLLALGELRVQCYAVCCKHLIARQRTRRKDDLRLMVMTASPPTTSATATASTASPTALLVELLSVLMMRLRLRLCLGFTHDVDRLGLCR
jgi:hypothetical protein